MVIVPQTWRVERRAIFLYRNAFLDIAMRVTFWHKGFNAITR